MRKLRFKRDWLEIGLAAIVVVLAAIVIALQITKPRVDLTPKTSIAPVAKVTASPSPTPDPITIEAMMARTYTASPITTDSSLGNLGGYTASVVEFSSDGLKEYAYMAVPDGSEPNGGWPAIVLVHGYIPPSTYSTTGNAYSTWIRAWARAGFIVVQPDLRGNGNSAGQAVSGHWSPAYTYDVMNLIASLKSDAKVNPNRIGLAGHSMGGHVALNVAVISQTVAATLLANGVVGTMEQLVDSWPNSPAPNDQPVSVTRGELATLEQDHGTPTADPAWWNAASAINYVKNVKGPIQIDGDVGDTIVPYAWQQELSAALNSAGKQMTLYSYSGDDHQLSSSTNLPLFLARSTAFWQKNL